VGKKDYFGTENGVIRLENTVFGTFSFEYQ